MGSGWKLLAKPSPKLVDVLPRPSDGIINQPGDEKDYDHDDKDQDDCEKDNDDIHEDQDDCKMTLMTHQR